MVGFKERVLKVVRGIKKDQTYSLGGTLAKVRKLKQEGWPNQKHG